MSSAGTGQPPGTRPPRAGFNGGPARAVPLSIPTGPSAPLCLLAHSFLALAQPRRHLFFLKNQITHRSSVFNRGPEMPVIYERARLHPQLAQLVIDLNNQMQQKDREMQVNEAK